MEDEFRKAAYEVEFLLQHLNKEDTEEWMENFVCKENCGGGPIDDGGDGGSSLYSPPPAIP